MPRGRGYNPRSSRNVALRARLRASCFARGLPCAICGQPIDYTIPYRIKRDGKWFYPDDAPELDEIVPVSRYREGGYDSPEQCALDPENHQAVHRRCNRWKSNRFIGSKPNVPMKKPKAKVQVKSHKPWRDW